MKRLIFAGTVAAVAWAQPAVSQSDSSSTSDLSQGRFYIDGFLGVNFLNDQEFDIDGAVTDAEAGYKTGGLGGLAVGYLIPQGVLNIRAEGELSLRNNDVDSFQFGNGVVSNDVDGSTSALAGMANAMVDVYVAPGFALSAGGGLGFAHVSLNDIEAAVLGINQEVIDDSDTTYAYQLRLGARYDFDVTSTVKLGYTYFATGELDLEDAAGVGATATYNAHGLHIGYAYHF